VFYDTSADAEAAGFRPCKRCRPAEPAVRDHAEVIASACRTLQAAETPPSLKQLADAAGLSPHHFHRVFKACTGVTPRDYATAHRSERARQALRSSSSVIGAAFDAGFDSAAPFYAQADAMLGMTPQRYRRGGHGEAIVYASAPCALGHVLVGRTSRGICAIFLGDEPAALQEALRVRFPHAVLTQDNVRLRQELQATVAAIRDPQFSLELPLDIRGTAFQIRVWKALTEIERGHTESYREVAARIGAPRAVRAVAQACAANTIAVAIPCHRVVRSDGTLSGYRWGVERKRELLLRERSGSPPRKPRR
jgi:AraC family transcriptional regulator, regulatory protein of adaptative response / methylated-DNA-[protein]-cysteine methyltransferase